MAIERKRRREWDLGVGELVQFVALPGVAVASAADRSGSHAGRLLDLWWTPDHAAYVSRVLSSEDILAALREPVPVTARPDHLELRPGLQHGEVLVRRAAWGGEPAREWQVEVTEFGVRQLAGLVAAQARSAPCMVPPRWVPSDWDRVGRGVDYEGKVQRFATDGHPLPAQLSASAVAELGL